MQITATKIKKTQLEIKDVRAHSSGMPNKIWEVDACNLLGTCLEMRMQQPNLHCANKVRNPNKTTPSPLNAG
jgi:hypothetical protein